MNTDDEKKKQVLYHAQRTMYFNDLLIKQCDSWLSEEEGLRNVERRIRERQKAPPTPPDRGEKGKDNIIANTARSRNRLQTMLCKLKTSIIDNCSIES